MTLHKFVSSYKNQELAAEALGTNRQQLGRWLKAGAIIDNGIVYTPAKRKNSTKHYEVQHG
jgi:hypothetical protein